MSTAKDNIMGCDIHAMVECKRFQLREWDYAGTVDIDRSYKLFGMLAGVRDNSVEPVSPPRGVPEDASYKFQEMVEWWGEDGHTPSWLTLRDLLDYPYDEIGYLQFLIDILTAVAKYQGVDASKVRVCFLFDN